MLGQAPAAVADVGYEELRDGRNVAAIATIELNDALEADDPARLINLGIAYARQGEGERARSLFEAAARSDNRVQLETAGGEWRDSRYLARKALTMLDRGDFGERSRLTMR
ncbi:MAG: hypothetical protein KDD98_11940 [Sphingomonadaceae bacterium]|nr:hypothetical protein [Sphingomonadaceae bacterium]